MQIDSIFSRYTFANLIIDWHIKTMSFTDSGVMYHAIIIMIAILFLAVASIFTSSVESHLNYINELFYGSPYVRWQYVFIGMQIAAVVMKRYFTTGLMNVMEIICTVCVGFWFVYRNIVGAPLVILRLADIILCAVCLFVFSIGAVQYPKCYRMINFCLQVKYILYIYYTFCCNMLC